MDYENRSAIEFSLANIITRHIEEYKLLYSKWKNNKDHKAFIDAQENIYLLILIIFALLEALINLYLSKKISNPVEFKKLEKNCFKKKWLEIPTRFNPNYKIENDLSDLLIKLIDQRKTIAHNKPFIAMDGNIIHEGNFTNIIDEKMIIKFAELPVLLLTQLNSYDNILNVELAILKQIFR
jgi:hypothetical protein